MKIIIDGNAQIAKLLGAESIIVDYYDIRNAENPKDISYYKGTDEWWYSNGKDHTIVEYPCNKKIRRTISETVWVINITSLTEFKRLLEKLDYGVTISIAENFPDIDLIIDIY